jgi:hypothetical protein
MGKGVGLGRDVRGVGYWFEGFGRGGGIGGRGGERRGELQWRRIAGGLGVGAVS